MEETTALLTALLSFLAVLVARWALKRRAGFQFFKRQGIPGPEPSFFSGCMPHCNEDLSGWIRKYGNVFGYYMGVHPYLVVNDVEMLKQVMIKDFQLFGNRPPEFIDFYPLDKSLSAIKDRHWKDVRSILSPTFSSGKIKLMTNTMNKKVDLTVEIVSKKVESNEAFDIFKLMERLTLDVVADCALAIKSTCQKNPEDEFLAATQVFTENQTKPLVQLTVMLPMLHNVFKLMAKYLTTGRLADTAINSVHRAIRARRKNPDAAWSVDLLQLMLKSQGSDGSSLLTDEEMAQNAYLFLVGGYDTTSSALGFTFYLLITNPEIQERLYREIEDIEDCSYNTIQNIPFLDQVLNESLRLFPPVTRFTSRHCDEDCRVGSITIKRGTRVLSPTWDIHHDPQLWADPETFDPDRFSPENKGNIKNLSFQPFGIGPRNCIGSRFAQLESKLAIFRLLKRFRFEKCEKTVHPINISNKPFNINPESVWVRAVPRN